MEGVDVLHEGVLGGQHQAAVRTRLGEVRVIVQPLKKNVKSKKAQNMTLTQSQKKSILIWYVWGLAYHIRRINP